MISLPKGHQGNAKVVEELKKKYEGISAKIKKNFEETDQICKNTLGHEREREMKSLVIEYTKQIGQECQGDEKMSSCAYDAQLCPETEEFRKISMEYTKLQKRIAEKAADLTIRKNKTYLSFARVLGQDNEFKDRLNCIYHVRSKDRLGLTVLKGQIKLLHSLQRNLSLKVAKGFSKREKTPIKEWRKKLQAHDFLYNHSQENIDRMVQCTEKKKQHIAEQGKLFVQTKKECVEKVQELDAISLQYDENVLGSEPYKEVVEIGEILQYDIIDIKHQIEKKVLALKEDEKQLWACQNTPKSYDGWIETWKEFKESVHKRSVEVQEQQKNQESLKEMIRDKTGELLREEIRNLQLQSELDQLTFEKDHLGALFKDMSYQTRKLNLTYKRFVDIHPLTGCPISL
ncbi:MAG: hypothetical protein AAF391_14280 [Bacteroidota bacterium]